MLATVNGAGAWLSVNEWALNDMAASMYLEVLWHFLDVQAPSSLSVMWYDDGVLITEVGSSDG